MIESLKLDDVKKDDIGYDYQRLLSEMQYHDSTYDTEMLATVADGSHAFIGWNYTLEYLVTKDKERNPDGTCKYYIGKVGYIVVFQIFEFDPAGPSMLKSKIAVRE